MVQCSICASPIEPSGQYLTIIVHNDGKAKKYEICGARCFVRYGTTSGLMEVAGVGPTSRFNR